jgi:hypothetical protein
VWRPLLALAVILLGPLAAAAQAPAPACGDKPLLVPGKHSIYQRIITRPGVTISQHPGPGGQLPAAGFDVFYVYCRQGDWVQVGRSMAGHTDGWMPAAKTIDWKHAMVAEFTNPANRGPVLFLKSEQDETNLLLSPDLGAAGAKLRADAQAGHPGPLIAQEPANYVDILRNFYLLPILSAKEIEREIPPASMRLLEVISAPDTPPAAPSDRDRLRDYKASLVFVIDTTLSMQPYIDATRDAIRSVITQIGTTQLASKFRFGLIAYRDSLTDTALLEYPVKVYAKPDFTQPPDAILPQIAAVQQATVSSQGFDEDPIGGLQAALNDIDWNAVAGKYVILITDAGARPGNHPHSITGMNIKDIKAEAERKNVSLSVIHLLTAAGAAVHDHEPARRQYEDLTFVPAASASSYFPVPNGSPQEFQKTVLGVVNFLLQDVARQTGVPVTSLRTPGNLSPAQQAQLQVVAEAMKLAYQGRVEQTRAPDVVHSFTTDRDLANPDVPSVNIRVLLTRNQLSDLAGALNEILRAGVAGRAQPQMVFTQLREIFARTAVAPDQIRNAHSLGAMISEYVDDLPFQSEIMSISEQDWLAMGAIKQDEVLNDIRGKLRFYQEYQEHPDFWKDVTHSGNEGDKVALIPLDRLP